MHSPEWLNWKKFWTASELISKAHMFQYPNLQESRNGETGGQFIYTFPWHFIELKGVPKDLSYDTEIDVEAVLS